MNLQGGRSQLHSAVETAIDRLESRRDPRWLPWLMAFFLSLVGGVHGQSPNDGFNPGITNTVTAVAVQEDGKIVVVGNFISVGGALRTNIARLNSDGTLDAAFAPVATVGSTWPDLVIQGDGKILARSGQDLVRFLPNGVVDPEFHPATNGGVVALQADGKILTGRHRLQSNGEKDPGFTQLEPEPHSLMAACVQPNQQILVAGGPLAPGYQIVKRFHTDGTRDASFNARVRLPFSIVEYSYVGSLALQPDGKVLIGGWFSFVDEQPRSDFTRLNRDGSLDTNFFSGPYDPIYSGSPRAIVVQPDGKILVATTRLRRHLPDGRIDPEFNFVWDGSPDARCVALQSDGKILLGGRFTSTNGAPPRGLLRLYPDGSLDDDFSGPRVSPRGLAIQPNGKLVVGAYGFGSWPEGYLVRLSINGVLDSTFQANVNSNVTGICVQSDGKVVAVGHFYQVGGQERFFAARVQADGALDQSFDAGPHHLFGGDLVYAAALQDDGKLLLGQTFSTVNGQRRPGLVRLRSEGNVDDSFAVPSFSPENCADCNTVWQVVVQSDRKLLVTLSRYNSSLGGSVRTNLVRLHPEGTLDSSFQPEVIGEIVALQRDGKILVQALERPNQIVRLHPTGAIDSSFNASLSGRAEAVALQADGRMVVSTGFEVLRLNANGVEDPGFTRLSGSFGFLDALAIQSDGKILIKSIERFSNPTPAWQSLVFDRSSNLLLWRRGGSSPEVEFVVFERSLDGTNYTTLGAGIPDPEGWRLPNVVLPLNTNVYVRARGRVSTWWKKTSSSLVESVAQFHVQSKVLPRLVLTGSQGGTSGFVQYHFINPLGLRYGLLATTNVSLPEHQWQRLRDPELDIFDVDGRYWFWEPTTNATRFYQLTEP